jgi:hypothetical protein
MAPLVVPYARATADHGTYGLDYTRTFHPGPQAWFTPAKVSVHRELPWVYTPEVMDGWSEKQLFPGLMPILAVAVGLGVYAARPNPRARLASGGIGAATVLAAALLVTDVSGAALHDVLYFVPGVAGMRVIGRVIVVLAFPFGLATAAGVELAASVAAARCGVTTGRLVAAALLALLVADQRLVGVADEEWQWLRFPAAESVVRRERLANVIRRHPRPTLVYVYPPNEEQSIGWYVTQVDAAAAAQAVGIPTVNGWSGYTPPGWVYFTDHTELYRWLVEEHRVPEADLDGLVVIGDPLTPGDPAVEAELRRRFPPVPRP